MKPSRNYPIDGAVEVDETMIGGKVEAKRGRSQTTKKQVVIAIQIHPKGGFSRAYVYSDRIDPPIPICIDPGIPEV